MATVNLDSFSLIRSSTVSPVAISPPISASSLSGRRSSVRLPQYSGLKLRPVTTTRLLSHASSRITPRGGSVVCEARDTAVEGLSHKTESFLCHAVATGALCKLMQNPFSPSPSCKASAGPPSLHSYKVEDQKLSLMSLSMTSSLLV